MNFSENDISIDDESLDYIIENLTEKESGVRNLKRCYEIIYTKLNLLKLLKSAPITLELKVFSFIFFPNFTSGCFKL